MISQNFIKCDNSSFFSIIKYPENRNTKNIVLLIPGFGESKCDLDYFLNNLSDYFVENGFITMQVDLYAHGDSYGSFEELNCEIIKANIISAIKYIKKHSDFNIYVVCRGIYIEFLSQKDILRKVDGFVGINPVKFAQKELIDIERAISIKDEIVEIGKIDNQEIISKFLIALGAEPDNMYAQKINRKFVNDIINQLKKEEWSKTVYENSVWISSNIENLDVNVEFKYSDVQCKTLNYYAGYAFPRDITWQYKFILNILSNVIRMSKGRTYAHTISV